MKEIRNGQGRLSGENIESLKVLIDEFDDAPSIDLGHYLTRCYEESFKLCSGEEPDYKNEGGSFLQFLMPLENIKDPTKR